MASTALTARRVIALVFIAVAAVALAVLQPGRAPDPVSVPSGAHAGQLDLKPFIAGVMVMLPLLLALALAGIAKQVRRRNRLRGWSSALVRTLFAAIFGLAGWMAALIIMLATSARIAVDDRSLVLVAVALPVASAAYYGWSDLRRATRSRRTGLAAAVAGAVIGAWLGFGAGEDFAAILTAIVGAVASANLALVARDIWAGDEAPPRPAPPDLAEIRPALTQREEVMA